MQAKCKARDRCSNLITCIAVKILQIHSLVKNPILVPSGSCGMLGGVVVGGLTPPPEYSYLRPWLVGGDESGDFLRTSVWVLAPELGLEVSFKTRDFMKGAPALGHTVPIWGLRLVTGHLSLHRD